MLYINQLDYPDIPYITRTSMQGENYETGQKTTIRSSGCGLCAAMMAADRLLPNVEFTLEQALELSYKSGANTSVGTNYSCFAPAFANKFGFKLLASMDVEDLQNCLRTGVPGAGRQQNRRITLPRLLQRGSCQRRCRSLRRHQRR